MQRVASSILHHKQFDGLDVGKGLIRFDIRPGGWRTASGKKIRQNVALANMVWYI